jgi:tRNA A37 threonylcarbamoyladenosine biosynthesis protein TsaE
VRNLSTLNFLTLKCVDTGIFIRRKFIDTTARCNRWDQERNEYVDEYDKPIKTFDEISGTEATKVILLLDETKAGKTSTFKSIATRLKDKFTNKWIIFVDHKHHADVYRTCKSTESEWNQSKLAQFISEEILELKDFEQKMFEEFFVEGRVVILIEMNVFYQEILDFAVRIVEMSQNQLWISSWPQHADKLESAFNISAFKLVPFDSENRREFFIKFLNSKGINEEQEVEGRLKELEDFLQIHSKEDNFPCDIPLMLRMIAEVYENSLAGESKYLFKVA